MIFELFSSAAAAELRAEAEKASFVDGRVPGVGPGLIGAKANEQAEFDDPWLEAVTARVKGAFLAHPEFVEFAHPRRWAKMRMSRYGVGAEYGRHVDSPIFYNGGWPVRTDLSFTLFLCEPGEYDGGELCLHRRDGVEKVRLPAGTALVYPGDLVHEVQPVTRGERIVCAGWIQSIFRRPEERELLSDLARLRGHLAGGEGRLELEKIIASLKKIWMDP